MQANGRIWILKQLLTYSVNENFIFEIFVNDVPLISMTWRSEKGEIVENVEKADSKK